MISNIRRIPAQGQVETNNGFVRILPDGPGFFNHHRNPKYFQSLFFQQLFQPGDILFSKREPRVEGESHMVHSDSVLVTPQFAQIRADAGVIDCRPRIDFNGFVE